MGRDGITCSQCLSVGACDFEPPERVPRTSARAQTRARGVRAGSLRGTEPRAREKGGGRRRTVCRCAKNANVFILIYIYISMLRYTYRSLLRRPANIAYTCTVSPFLPLPRPVWYQASTGYSCQGMATPLHRTTIESLEGIRQKQKISLLTGGTHGGCFQYLKTCQR